MPKTEHSDITPDIEQLEAIRDPMIGALRECQSALDAVNALASTYNGRGDVKGALRAYEAREAILGLQHARQAAHNRIAALLVAQYGEEQAAQIIIQQTRGGGR